LEGGSYDVSGLWWKSLLVAVISFAFFAYGVGQAGVASALTNNVDRVYAQDESVYTNVALHMAAHGNWLTPIFLGRIFLYKPPMLHALAGLSLKALGISLFALRLPSLLAASLAVALLFAWSTRERGLWAGIAVVLLLISNVLWVTFARLCYTDMLQASFTVAAMFWLARDPRLERASTRLIFSAVCAAAILSKSAAGVLPLLALGLYAFAGPREARPTIQRVAGTTAWTALFLAPWYVYQLAVHGQWFWTDYVRVQLLNFGTESSLSGSKEVPLLFYLKRLFLIDPFLCIGAVLAVPGFIVGMRLRKPEVRLLACWVFVVLAGLSAFQYRNFYYVLMLIAPLCLAIPYCLPARSVRWLTLVLALVFGLKVTASDRVWSLSYYASRPLAAAP
jgi:4-amino-4-deoxy-L-arabinose transferase-like glycosyltransferase